MKTIIAIFKISISFLLVFLMGCSSSQWTGSGSHRFASKLNQQEYYITTIEFPSLATELDLGAGFDRDNLAYVYSRIGNYYRWKGNYPKDLAYQEKALGKVDCVNCLIKPYLRSQLALAYYYIGYYHKAVSQLLSAIDEMDTIDVDKLVIIEGYSRESPYYIRALINTYLSLNYYHDGSPAEAEQYARDAIEASYGYKRTEEYRLPMALGLRVLGIIRIDDGKAAEAVKYLQQSLSVLTDGTSEITRSRFYDIMNDQKLYLARAYFLLGEHDTAIDTLSNIDRPTHEFQWRAHLLKGMIYQDQKLTTQATVEFRESINELERARSVLGKHGFKISFMNNKQEPYSKIINTLYQLGRNDEAFVYAEKAKARAFLDLLANVDAIGQKDQETEILLKKEQALKEKIFVLQAKLEVHDTYRGQFDVNQKTDVELRSTQKELEVFYDRYMEKNLDFASIKTANILSVADIRRLIGNDLTIITYYYDDQNLYIWTVNKSSFKNIMKPLPIGGLESKVKIYRQMLLYDIIRSSKTVSHNLKTLENQLSELLLSDVMDEIDTEKIYIIPHGALHYLPFQALRYGSRYLVERYQVGYCPSANALQYVFAKRKERGVNILALGNPYLGKREMDLPGAEEEVRHLAKIFSNSKVLVQRDASEFQLKNLAGQYDIIHIASHAEFDSNKPLQSCLRLAASEKEDGRLTTKEVFNINLDAYLVTLSGCETALGKITNGDEVTGLSRAFIYAGTPSILGTLWRVHDESTKMLMEKFYLNLQRMDKFKALQLAQLDMLNDPVYGKPFFWAPFQITGDYY